MQILNKRIEAYIESHSSPESHTLTDLVKESEKNLEFINMISGSQVGQLLKLLVRIGKCKRVLEIGTFTGYSAIWMADALPDDGQLITLELNERYHRISDRFFSMPPYDRKIRQIMGPALESLGELEGTFDLIFIDADKVQYPAYYREVKSKLAKDGILVVDNALWGGRVLQPADRESESIDQLNKLIRKDPDFENLLLPVRDGLLVAVKTRE